MDNPSATLEVPDVRCSDHELSDAAIDALANFLVNQAVRELGGDDENHVEAA